MDPAFEAAAAALQPYAVSPEPAETAYGYHVILRMPTTGGDVLDFYADGSPYLLRADAAQAVYTQMVHAWIDDAKVEWAEGFEALDVQKLFTREEAMWEKIDFLHWFHD
jgi:parvulin-like peptidyl-prolyl isomerase